MGREEEAECENLKKAKKNEKKKKKKKKNGWNFKFIFSNK
jgi:hypothetical protein